MYKKKYGGIPEISASDLDNDGDLDIVISRVGDYYVGKAIQIVENLGNKKFKDYGIIPLVSADGWIDGIRFRDLDKDGDIDLYLSSERVEISGAVVINNGNFDFSLIMPPESYELYEKLDVNVYSNVLKKVLTKEEQSVEDELAAFEAELEEELAAEAEDAVAKRKAKVAAAQAKAAAAKAKRLAEEAAKSAETDTVDTEQSVEDEIAAFEAELEAELGE